MAAKIKDKTPVREIFAQQLVDRGVMSQEESDAIQKEIWDGMAERHRELKEELSHAQAEQPTGGYQLDRSPSPEVKTAVSADRLLGLNEDLLRMPEGFNVHPKLLKQLERRRDTIGPDGGIDWAHAEALAFASLLSEGTPVRLTGQDVERGTFSQRHLVLHDVKTGQRVSPIQQLPGALAPMELHNSPLSEIACLGFEYGYSMEAPETLVLWEAQFGDFVNSAQVIVDQFIISALAKWGQTTRLTLLLPHGYEGSGPEHSSARLERFLTLAAEGNMRVANLTTPAQYFHLLRRQARVAKQRPLIIMTPKSLLRLPQATSRIEHLAESRFFPVLSEPRIDEEKVTRLVLCSGKVFYDLKGHATRENNEGVAISRVELLYPFPQTPDRGGDLALPEPARGRLGPGGAAQHGRPRPHVAADAADAALLARVRLHRPARARLAGRGLPGRPHAGADADHPHGAGSLDPGVGQPGQGAGRALAVALHLQASLSSATLGAPGCRNAGRNHPPREAPTYVREDTPLHPRRRARAGDRDPVGRRRLRRGPLAAARQAQPEPQRFARGHQGDRDHRVDQHLRHAPVQQARRRRRRRHLRLPLRHRQGALHPRQQPQGRPRLRVRDHRQGGAAGSRSATPPAHR